MYTTFPRRIRKVAKDAPKKTALDSVKSYWDNNSAGLTATAGLGGLAGYLLDQATGKKNDSLLKSLLLAGGGMALGAGAYGLTKAHTAAKDAKINARDTDKTPQMTWLTPLATVGGGYGGYRAGSALGDSIASRALRRAQKQLDSLTESGIKIYGSRNGIPDTTWRGQEIAELENQIGNRHTNALGQMRPSLRDAARTRGRILRPALGAGGALLGAGLTYSLTSPRVREKIWKKLNQSPWFNQ